MFLGDGLDSNYACEENGLTNFPRYGIMFYLACGFLPLPLIQVHLPPKEEGKHKGTDAAGDGKIKSRTTASKKRNLILCGN